MPTDRSPAADGNSTDRGALPNNILDSLLEGCQVIGRDWRYLYVNDAVARQGRRPKEQLLGRTMMEAYPGIDQTPMFALLRECMDDRHSRRLENEFTFPDGSQQWFELRFEPVPEGVFILSLEITDRKRAETAQRLEAIGQLAGGVAHDFNNILSVQLGYCELLEGRLDRADPLADTVAKIKEATMRAATLTRQLLAFSRRQVLQPQIIDLNFVVSELESMLTRLIGEDIEFTTSLAADVGLVEADPGQIEQVIMNLAVNARDAMPDGGKLSIATSSVVLDEVGTLGNPGMVAGPHVMLEVADTGCGMDEATRQRVFEPFFTTKPLGKGTGLGLATVYGIVRQSGGTILVDSEPGVCTSFRIYLPQVDAEPTPRGIAVAHPPTGAGELVLLAEDNDAVRGLLTSMVERLGYRVIAAADGASALAAFENQRLRPDLLISDVIMPGMSGPTLAARLRELQPDLKTLFLSGYANNEIGEDVELDANTLFLSKPSTMAELAAKIRQALDGG
ncbi:MAG: response regulator [Planctomycetes bacterium]|nr:response regulator [Planctomycetota bacterium]